MNSEERDGAARARSLMVQGTASHVGKSTLVAGLCRWFYRSGYNVAPFKSQNMSLNAAVTEQGEIGRAQATQAVACGLKPTVDMNPVLLKPAGSRGCQVVVQGRVRGYRKNSDYGDLDTEIRNCICTSYARLAERHDLIVLEGAGSPAEINLLDRDFANMWMAEQADASVILIGDIECGGVFAALYGTWMLAPHRERIRGFVLNKFRGDTALLSSGLDKLRALTGVPTLGILPYVDLPLPEEDALEVASPNGSGSFRIGVIQLPHISNSTDFGRLKELPGVELKFVWDSRDATTCDALIVPGTKCTVEDLDALRACGLDSVLKSAAISGKPVVGICGGYQMLGETIADPDRVESDRSEVQGLGLLPVRTVFRSQKRLEQLAHGYVIQNGIVTRHGGGEWPAGSDEGCRLGSVRGTSLHGIFDNDGLLAEMLREWGLSAARLPAHPTLDMRLNSWADMIAAQLDMDAIRNLAGIVETAPRV